MTSPVYALPLYPVFHDLAGRPLNNGFIYIGQPGQSAEAAPLAVYWDDAETQPVSQPIRTVNGYPSRNGSQGAIYVSGDYSITVMDTNRTLVYSALEGVNFAKAAIAAAAAYTPAYFEDLPELLTDETVWPADQILNTRKEGFSYQVLPVIALDADITTDVGVKLRAFSGDDGFWNVMQFGARGDGVTDDTSAIKRAIVRGPSVFIPAGNFMHDGTITIPSGRNIRGAGFGVTTLSVINSAGANAWGLNVRDASFVTVSDLKLFGNVDRLTPPFVFSGGPFGTGMLVRNSKYVTVERVHSVDWAKHCFDVSANAYTSPDGVTYLDNGRSEYVTFNECYAKGGGDDNFTTHQSDWIRISNCFSESPSGLYVPNNTNCYEIDDGSRYVFLTNVFARDGACGIQVKGHTGQPAAQGVIVDGAHIWDCNYGVDCYNTSLYGDGSDTDGATYSTTARDLTLKNIYIRNPIEARDTGEELPFAVRVRSYASVEMSNIHISNASGDFHEDALIHVSGGARNVKISGVHFTACSGFEYGVYTTSFARRVEIEGVFAINCTGKTTNSAAVRLTALGDTIYDNVTARSVYVNFCTNLAPIESSARKFALSTRSNEVSRVQTPSRSLAGAGGAPTVTISHGWVEGSNDLSAGEGTAWEMTAQLVTDAEPVRVAALRSNKSNGTDTSRAHDLIAEARDTAETLQVVWQSSNGWFAPRLVNAANDAAAATAGVPVGGLYHNGGAVRVRLT
jgi:hypothetical protein